MTAKIAASLYGLCAALRDVSSETLISNTLLNTQ
jgi:hypothetical protein